MKLNKKKTTMGVLATTGAAIVPIFAVVSCGKDIPTLTAKGSSTVLPFMQGFSKKYDGAQVNVAGGGSGAGQKAILMGEVDFGNMSATPDSKEIVNSDKFRTVTVGIDGLAMVIKGNSKKAKIDNILKLYTEEKGNKQWLLAAKAIFGMDANANNVEVLSRENPDKSGTAEIFGIGLGKLSGTGQNRVSHHPKKSELKGVTSTTNEANSEAFKSLSGSSKKYGITYLSLGVADSLIKGKSNFSKLTLISNDGKHKMIPNKENVGKTYNWARPLNVIYNTKANNKQDVINFIEGMMSEGQKSLANVGYLKLTDEQKKSEGILKNDDKEFLESNKTNGHNGLAIDIKW
ncbi:PstS family phosphate ABC transporter substrate-binding protein [Mycoplasma todarodis]|uniref:PBP domain-containing protein n=1 Tax=Mycoplasma todarodis TaxID=1937191 RepID=A0A4R0XNM8_9MOLU|nr:substrate-binding domain-containing protein [Mycoplasma todarodis]TCG11102.1 hypothetical protein C4B25_02315 [Mycoplasma todarodis]